MEIEICKTCKGEGDIKVNSDFRSGDFEMANCPKCNGTGRVLINTYRYEVPFNSDRSIIYEVDSDIHLLIRELEAKVRL